MNKITVEIKLMGVVRDRWGKKIYKIAVENSRSLLINVFEECAKDLEEKFWIFFDRDFTPKRGIIIIVDGVDYKVKGGLNLQISSDTEITILSAIHGG
ncbi:MAG: hypothetical protein ACW981_02165 [Candidatus Hodarchaeales archaeon]|jgi:molybdopterin converting factor small subunit